MVAAVVTRADEESRRLSSDTRVGQQVDLPMVGNTFAPLIEQRMPSGPYVLRVLPALLDVQARDLVAQDFPGWLLDVQIGVGGVNDSLSEDTGAIVGTLRRRFFCPSFGVSIPVRGSYVRALASRQTSASGLGVRALSSLSPGEIVSSQAPWSGGELPVVLDSIAAPIPAYATHLEVTCLEGLIGVGFRLCGVAAAFGAGVVAPGETVRVPIPRTSVQGVVSGLDPVIVGAYAAAWVVQS